MFHISHYCRCILKHGLTFNNIRPCFCAAFRSTAKPYVFMFLLYLLYINKFGSKELCHSFFCICQTIVCQLLYHALPVCIKLIFCTSYALNQSWPCNFIQNSLFLSQFLWLLICPQCRVWKKVKLLRLCKHVGQHFKSHRFASFFFCCIVVCNNRLFGSWSVWESVFRVGTCSVDRESSVVVNTGVLCIIRIRLSFCYFFVSTIWLSIIIKEVVLAFDTPVIQDLSFIGAQIVKEFDGTNRIFTALGNSNTPANGSSLIQKGFFYLIFS